MYNGGRTVEIEAFQVFDVCHLKFSNANQLVNRQSDVSRDSSLELCSIVDYGENCSESRLLIGDLVQVYWCMLLGHRFVGFGLSKRVRECR